MERRRAGRASARPARMTTRLLCIVAAVASLHSAPSGARLEVSRIAPAGTVTDALIVGRAACADSTWLLTDKDELIAIAHSGATVVARAVRGLLPADKVWGLSCLSDGTLWTMASPRGLARIDQTGRVQERVAVQLPRIALFSAADRLLFQQLPTAPGVEALATSPPHAWYAVQPWPGLLGRAAKTREDQLTRNLINCGIALTDEIPCWFADDPQVTISDGRSVRRMTVPWPRTMPVDKEAPIWDVALVPSGSVWVLANIAGSRNRRAGGRLFFTGERTNDRLSLDLIPPARVIVAATASRCVLLATDGSLLEVLVKP